MRAGRDLIAGAALALLCGIVVLCVPVEGVEVAAAIPLCLLLPGYAITVASFAGHRLEFAQLLLFSLGLSLATLATGSLILNYTPGGLRAVPWAVLLVLVVLAGCAVAGLRRPARQPAIASGPRLRVGLADGVLLLGAVVTVAATVALARTPLSAENAVGYTRLWILPSENSARIGVASAEQAAVAYRLEVRSGAGQPVSSTLRLRPGQERILRIPTGRSTAGRPRPVTALLFRDDDPNVVYRRVSAWVSGPRASG